MKKFLFSLILLLSITTGVFIPNANAQSGWNLVFSDEFNGSSLNTGVWGTLFPGGGQCESNEDEVYKPSVFTETGGYLNIAATNDGSMGTNPPPYYCPGPWSSGIIQTYSTNSFTYGYFEMRAKIPSGAGFWPAFWLDSGVGSGGNIPPETDIMEMLNTDTTIVYQTYHSAGFANNPSYTATSGINCATSFCDWAVDWEPGTLTFYLNGVATFTYSGSDVSSTAQYILANLAVGGAGSYPGSWNGSTPSPSQMQIDYIRAYQHPGSGSGCYSNIPGPTPIPSTSCGSSQVATPTFSPSSGNVPQTVTISTSTGGATLCYTSDNSTPTGNGAGTCTHGTTVSGAVSVAVAETLKAIGTESGPYTDSAVGSATYTSGGSTKIIYVDYTSGSDSNNSCLSKVSPCKHAPGMAGLNVTGGSTGDGCVANCAAFTMNPGDSIILKGGTVWPYTVAPWNTPSISGGSSNQTYGCAGSGCLYIGYDPTWNQGQVTSITLTRDLGGWNPSSPPSISCSGGGGSNAAATPLVMPTANNESRVAGFIYHITLTNSGSNYTSNPTCTLSGGGSATLAADINRPIYDLGSTQGSPPDWPIGQAGTYPTVAEPGINIGAYTILDHIEVRNLRGQAPTGSGSNDNGGGMINVNGQNSTVSNTYVHNMNVDCYFSGSCPLYDVAYVAIYVQSPFGEAANNTIENGDAGYVGNSTQQSNSICNNGSFCTPFEFGIQTGTQGGLGPESAHGNREWANFWQLRYVGNDASGSQPYLSYGNEFWLTSYATNYTAHINSRYMQLITPASLISYNNVVHNEVGGTSSQIECFPGMTLTYFNEIQWATGDGTQSYSLDMADTGGAGGCTLNLYNDTMVANSGVNCVNSQSGSNTTTITLQNLQCISQPTAINPFWSTGITNSTYQNSAGSTVQANVQAASTVQSISTANGQGYVNTNLYAPTSTNNATYMFASGGTSANLTSLCSGNLAALCSDINGNARPASGGWQSGAYMYSGSGPVIRPPTNLTIFIP